MAIGLKASAPLSALEMTFHAILAGTCTKEYILQLVALETEGACQAEKINLTIRRMTVNNPLLPFFREHEQAFVANLSGGRNRVAVMVAVMCAAYPLFYDMVSTLGKYFHAQEEVTRAFLADKLTEKYGTSFDARKGINCAIKMLVEAGLIMRPRNGVFMACRMEGLSEFAHECLKRVFVMYNPSYTLADDMATYPFFEFVND